MFKSNDERAAREKRIRDETIAAGIKAGLREAVVERLREILPERQDELDRAHKFRISPNGFIVDVDEATRRRMLVRLHEAQASANRLLGHGRDKRKAVALMLSYRNEMEEKFLPLLRRFIWLFDDE